MLRRLTPVRTVLTHFCLAAIALLYGFSTPYAAVKLPLTGQVNVTVIPCYFSRPGLPPVETRRELKQRIDDGLTYWNEIGNGRYKLVADHRSWVVGTGFYSAAKAWSRTDIVSKCSAAAAAEQSLPSDGIWIIYTVPGLDTGGILGKTAIFSGTTRTDQGGGHILRLDRPSNLGMSRQAVIHEIGHAMGLSHQTGVDIHHDEDRAPAEYGAWYAALAGGYDTTVYTRDRLGTIPRQRIYQFGKDGETTRRLRLADPGHSGNPSGYHLVRIPFLPSDPNRYLMVEWASKRAGWDPTSKAAPQLYIYESAKTRNYIDPWNSIPTPRNGDTPTIMMLAKAQVGTTTDVPSQIYDRYPVSISVVSTDTAAGTAEIEVRNSRAQVCIYGSMPRNATATDDVCVTHARRGEVARENRAAAARTQPNGQCKQGYVWREATPTDRTCVPPASRDAVRAENRQDKGAHSLRLRLRGQGPNTCKPGLQPRFATPLDWVCVSPERAAKVARDNATAQPGACPVFSMPRSATADDTLCVDWFEAFTVANENRTATDNLAFPQ